MHVQGILLQIDAMIVAKNVLYPSSKTICFDITSKQHLYYRFDGKNGCKDRKHRRFNQRKGNGRGQQNQTRFDHRQPRNKCKLLHVEDHIKWNHAKTKVKRNTVVQKMNCVVFAAYLVINKVSTRSSRLTTFCQTCFLIWWISIWWSFDAYLTLKLCDSDFPTTQSQVV